MRKNEIPGTRSNYLRKITPYTAKSHPTPCLNEIKEWGESEPPGEKRAARLSLTYPLAVVWGLGFRVQGFSFGVKGLGFRV